MRLSPMVAFGFVCVVIGCGSETRPLPPAGSINDDPKDDPTWQVPGSECNVEGATQLCFDANPVLMNVGECLGGIQICTLGSWSECTGQVLPTEEICDGRDNNCDGKTDEGVLSPCGDCDPSCGITAVGGDNEDGFSADETDSSNFSLTPEGWLTLEATEVDMSVIWIANTGENTVSKLNTNTGAELGRYRVCTNPSRTAVGMHGDGWIACRDEGGAVGRIINFEGECTDKNGNGVIDTSRDLNDDKVISTDEMYDKGQDECLEWVVQIGSQNGDNVARALGVAKDGYGWAGLWNAKKLVKIAPENGDALQTIDIPVNPYGLVIDKQGVIWVAGRGGSKLVRADPTNGSVNSYAPNGSLDPYGIALDEFGRIWIANCCSFHAAWMYDPNGNVWQSVGTGARPRGIVSNGKGRIFVANDESNQVAVIDAINMINIGTINLGSGRFPLGMAVDVTGNIWAVNQNSSSTHKINGNSLQIIGEYPVGSSPYTYSDMTGTAFFDVIPPGWYRHRFAGTTKAGLTGIKAKTTVRWQALIIDYMAPPGSYVKVRFRTANTPDEMAQQGWTPFFGPFPEEVFPFDITQVFEQSADLLDVEVWLYPSTNSEAMPVLKGIHIQYNNG